ncbi:hypothetical protein SUGI_0896310 [Cryptomeria japonica]|nr:hypothetical protein SUGI_0896310 [Cryptomeria japonica]
MLNVVYFRHVLIVETRAFDEKISSLLYRKEKAPKFLVEIADATSFRASRTSLDVVIEFEERIHLKKMWHNSPPPRYDEPHMEWSSPAIYIFIGLATIMGLLAFVLLFLICTCRLASGNLRGTALQERQLESMVPHPIMNEIICLDNEKALVIMPGEQKPTFLATQLPSVCDTHTCEEKL